MEITNVFQYAWLSTYQIVISPEGDKDCNDIAGWGSGFFLVHNERYFFVTADHNLHMRDYEKGERTGAENHIFIHNNIRDNDNIASVLTPMGNFFYYDKYDYSQLFNNETHLEDIDIEVLEIPDLIDIAFCEVQRSIERPFLTHELVVDDNVIVPGGEEKIIISSKSIAEPAADRFYLVEGVVENKIKGICNYRRNAVYRDLTYAYTKYGDYFFDYPHNIKYNEWKGISGSPIFDNHCCFVGMVVRVNDLTNQIQVVPAKKIVSLIEKQTEINNII